MLTDALELLRLCVSECAPGSTAEHQVIGLSGLNDRSPPESRPTAPIGVVRAACKAHKPTVLFGGQQQSVIRLLGEEEVRATHAMAPPPKVVPGRTSPTQPGRTSPPQAAKPMAASAPKQGPVAAPLNSLTEVAKAAVQLTEPPATAKPAKASAKKSTGGKKAEIKA